KGDPVNTDKIAELTKHLPQALSEKVTNAIEEDKNLSFIAMGSNATASGEGTWTDLLQQQLDNAYGKDVFKLTVKSFGDDLSIDVVQQQKYEKAANLGPDILLLEPFVLNDNGLVAVDDTLASVSTIITAFEEANED